MQKLLLLTVLLSGFFSGCQQVADSSRESKLPNIVLILADDMGYGDIQAYNPASGISTPNLNKLVSQGMHFTDAHTGSSVCSPTRYGLMTGRYAWRSRLKRGVLSGYSNHLIEPERPTIASVLKNQGYYTAVFGKWHLGVDYPWTVDTLAKQIDNFGQFLPQPGDIDYSQVFKHTPNSVGFDYSLILPGSLDMSPYIYLENERVTVLPDSISPLVAFPAFRRKGEISSDFSHKGCLDHFTEKATHFIREKSSSDQPFFLYFPLTGPHKPALPADRFEGKSGLGPYGDLVMQVDWTVGEVMKALDEAGISDNTLLIYTSDNGSYMYRIAEDGPDHLDSVNIQGFHPSHHTANYHWRGTKADIWEAGHRVPFIVRWPGKVQAGTQMDRAICLVDVFRTLGAVTEADIPEGGAVDSYNFLPLLTGEGEFERGSIVHHSVAGMFSLRSGKWKMIFGNGSGGREKPAGKAFERPYMLFDLENDPEETRDVILENADVARELESQLTEIMGQ